MAKRRTIRKLSEAERDTVRWMLADGYEPKHIAEHLGVDVRSFNGVMESPVARELSDLDRHLIGYRNAWVQYETERKYQRRMLAELTDCFDPGNDKHVRLQEHARLCGLAAHKHLELALKHAQAIRSLGGSVSAEFGGLSLSIDLGERGDLPGRGVVGDGSSGDTDDEG